MRLFTLKDHFGEIQAEGVEFSSGLIFMMPGDEMRREMDPTMWINLKSFIEGYVPPEGYSVNWTEELIRR